MYGSEQFYIYLRYFPGAILSQNILTFEYCKVDQINRQTSIDLLHLSVRGNSHLKPNPESRVLPWLLDDSLHFLINFFCSLTTFQFCLTKVYLQHFLFYFIRLPYILFLNFFKFFSFATSKNIFIYLGDLGEHFLIFFLSFETDVKCSLLISNVIQILPKNVLYFICLYQKSATLKKKKKRNMSLF